jgi:hypothetical protein
VHSAHVAVYTGNSSLNTFAAMNAAPLLQVWGCTPWNQSGVGVCYNTSVSNACQCHHALAWRILPHVLPPCSHAGEKPVNIDGIHDQAALHANGICCPRSMCNACSSAAGRPLKGSGQHCWPDNQRQCNGMQRSVHGICISLVERHEAASKQTAV